MIELKQAVKEYGPARYGQHRIQLYAAYDQSLVIEEGQVVGLFGANGSGKTTMLKAIMGLGELAEGEILIDGKPIHEQYDKISFITEEGSYFPQLNPYQYASFLADFFPCFDRKRYEKLLHFFGIDRHEKIKTFSRGERSKLEICAGFSKGAKYVLMDEPFLGNDLFSRSDFLKMMVASLEEKETVLISTHLIDEIENVVERALVMDKGRIKGDYYMDDLRQEGRNLADLLMELTGYNQQKYKKILGE